MADLRCDRTHPTRYGVCRHCGADADMECPYEGLDSDLLNIKPTLCVLGDASSNEECLACQ